MTGAFFVRGARDGELLPTELTRGPWSSEHQHGGPPSALVARALEQLLPELGAVRIVRITIELIRPVPIAPLLVRAEVERAGRRAQHLRASISADGEVVLRATALSLRTTEVILPELPPSRRGPEDELPASPEGLPSFEFPFFRDAAGYHKAIELRFARGTFGEGPTTVWLRARFPLVEGEALTPLQRVMLFSDSGNGVSVVLDTREYSFMNPDLTVHLLRYPEGEWVALDAITLPDPGGVGLAESRLWDRRGPIGRALQSLLVERRKS